MNNIVIWETTQPVSVVPPAWFVFRPGQFVDWTRMGWALTSAGLAGHYSYLGVIDWQEETQLVCGPVNTINWKAVGGAIQTFADAWHPAIEQPYLVRNEIVSY